MTYCREFMDIDLEQVPIPNLSPDWKVSHHGIAREKYEGWASNVKEIQRLREESGWTREQFKALRDSPNTREREIGETYRTTFESERSADAIRLVWDQNSNSFSIDNGNHRVWAAKARGLKRIRAEVSAPDRESIDRIRIANTRNELQKNDVDGNSSPRKRQLWEREVQPHQERNRERNER